MARAKKRQVAQRRQKKRARHEQARRRERKRLKKAGWPAAPFLVREPKDDIQAQIDACATHKALQDLARKYNVPKVRSYKAAQRETLASVIKAAAAGGGCRISTQKPNQANVLEGKTAKMSGFHGKQKKTKQ